MRTGYTLRFTLIITTVLLFQFQSLLSTNPVFITKNYHKVFVRDMDQYIDSSMTLGFDEFLNQPKLFYHSKERLQGTRNRKLMYWMKFQLTGDNLLEKDHYLICTDNRISHFELWFDDKTETPKPLGYDFAFGNRSINHTNFVFKIPRRDTVNITVRIQCNQSSFFSFEIKDEKLFYNDSYLEACFSGGAYGFIVLGILFCFFMLLKFKDIIYVTYPFFGATSLLIFLYIDGSGFQHIWGEYPEINLYLLLFLPIVLMFSLGFLVISVLDAWDRNHPYFRIIIGAILLAQIGYIFVFTIPEYFVHNIFYVIPFLAMLYCIIYKYNSGFKPILSFLIGFIFLMCANILYMMQPFFAAVYSSLLFEFAPHIGFLALIVSLTYSQFVKFYYIQSSRNQVRKKSYEQLKQLNDIKDRINEEIAEKVASQTRELERRNAVIHQQNAALQEFNDKLKEQTDEIVNLNLQLNEENKELKSDVQKITESRIFQNSIAFTDFKSFFDSNDSCYSLLEELKWKDGFKCSKCGNEKYGEGKGERARRCTKCGTNDSVTSNTIFHRLHFPIVKGFYILFLVNKHGDNLISKDLSELVDLRLATCWKFGKKVKEKKSEMKEAGQRVDSWIDLI